MLYKINDIFYSIIGEGYWTGTPAAFIRLAGCNKKCSWCDTNYKERLVGTEQSLLDVVQAFPSSVCVITGGEPLQQDLHPLLKKLAENNIEVHIETNGTHPIEPYLNSELYGWLSVSPKSLAVAMGTMKNADEVKILCGTKNWRTLVHDIKPYLNQMCIKWVMPLDNKNKEKNTKDAVEFVKQNPDWRLCVQMHKYLNIK